MLVALGALPQFEPKETRDADVIAGPLPVRLAQGCNTPAPVNLHVTKNGKKRFPCECMKPVCFSIKLLSGVKPELLFRYRKAGKRVRPISTAGSKPSAARGRTPFPKSLSCGDGLIDCVWLRVGSV